MKRRCLIRLLCGLLCLAALLCFGRLRYKRPGSNH